MKNKKLTKIQTNFKTNEISTISKILNKISVKGNIITWDALNTQKENVKSVIQRRGKYVVPINKINVYFITIYLCTLMKYY